MGSELLLVHNLLLIFYHNQLNIGNSDLHECLKFLSHLLTSGNVVPLYKSLLQSIFNLLNSERQQVEKHASHVMEADMTAIETNVECVGKYKGIYLVITPHQNRIFLLPPS